MQNFQDLDRLTAQCPICQHLFEVSFLRASGEQVWAAACPRCATELSFRLELDGDAVAAFEVDADELGLA